MLDIAIIAHPIVLTDKTPVLGKEGMTLAVGLDVLPPDPPPVFAAHVGTVMVSLIRVTFPFRAKSLPSIVAPLATLIELRARIEPLKFAVVLILAVSTLQKILHA